MRNHSPWRDFEKPTWPSLESDLQCEIAIIGGGISGIATLYYLLKSTQKRVVLLEKERIASGATGHNAGFAVATLEKGATELVEKHGKKKIQKAFEELDEAWELLHQIHEEIGFEENLIPFPKVVNGFDSLTKFLAFIENMQAKDSLANWKFILEESLPNSFSSVIERVSHEEILAQLNTMDRSYIAAAVSLAPFKGKRMNSALFCYKMLDYLQGQFPNRFSIYEKTDIEKIALHQDHSVLSHAKGSIGVQDLILCTNGYKHVQIWDEVKQKPFTKLHDHITPRFGYLAAYHAPSSESYALGFSKNPTFWYFSQVPKQLCVLGGPEFDAEDSPSSEWIEEKEKESLKQIEYFLHATFQDAPHSLPFFWYGKMGYTSSDLRWVGPDPEHPHLFYNLGCNGIGIVPAIAGAKSLVPFFSN